jgi:hypothetical protein
MKVFAVDPNCVGLVGQDPICGPTGLKPEFTNLASIVNLAMGYLFPIAGIILLLYLVWGGFDYMLAMGDPKKAAVGKGKITNAILGFFLIFAAFWILQILQFLFKLN